MSSWMPIPVPWSTTERAGKVRATLILALSIALCTAGCTRGALAAESERLFGDRLGDVEEHRQQGEDPAFVVAVRLERGSVSEVEACTLIDCAADSLSVAETITASFVVPPDDGTADLIDYSWSGATSTLVRWEGRSVHPEADGVSTFDAVAYASGMTRERLRLIADARDEVEWVSWPEAEDTTVAD